MAAMHCTSLQLPLQLRARCKQARATRARAAATAAAAVAAAGGGAPGVVVHPAVVAGLSVGLASVLFVVVWGVGAAGPEVGVAEELLAQQLELVCALRRAKGGGG